jgi:radical SAM protein with 4Fe4S-binding SPASM domain
LVTSELLNKKYRRAYVEISNICNLKCSFCPEVERAQQVMDAATFKRIAADIAPLVDEVCLHLMGEPLGHPELADIITACTEYKLPVNLTTNGMLITGHRRDLLLSPIVRQVNISVHSFEANFPTRDIEPYLQRVLSFARLAAELRPELYINLRLWDQKQGENLAESNALIRSTLEREFGVDLSVGAIDVRRRKQVRLAGRLSAHFDSRFIWPAMNLPHRSKHGFCHGLGSHFGVHADGRVVPCCLDKEAVINLGNALKTPISEILKSQRAVNLREGFDRGELVEDLCQRCPFISRFDRQARRLRAQSGASVGRPKV